MRTALGGVALLLTIAAAAAGCSDSDGNTAPPPSSTPAEPTTSSTPESPEDRASAAAEASVRRYVEQKNEVAANPRLLNRLKSVEVGTLLVADQNTFRQWQQKGWHATGSGVAVTKLQVGTVALDENPATVDVTVCTSVGGDVVDQQGRSVVPADRTKKWTTKYTVTNYGKKPPAGKWLVATAVDQAEGSCAL